MSNSTIFLCNGAKPPGRGKSYQRAQVLEYRQGQGADPNVAIGLPGLINSVLHLPPRVLDLIEIASYIFAGDRLTSRGESDSLEFHGWSRDFEFVFRVRDAEFWQQATVQDAIAAALRFMTGHRSFRFHFQPGHSTPSSQLFDASGAMAKPPPRPKVLLFSGGLDSVAGTLDVLGEEGANACLVSHESQSVVISRQRELVETLNKHFNGRIHPYSFGSSLRGQQAVQESQRSRSFLYLAMGGAVAHALGLNECSMYENGFTAIALPERRDLYNARASRTSHPRTLRLMETVLSLVFGKPFYIRSPFMWSTKSDIVRQIVDQGMSELFAKSISCSRTRTRTEGADQCGYCSQCLERRFAAYAAGVGSVDGKLGNYGTDVAVGRLLPDARGSIIDYLRAARGFAVQDLGAFEQTWVNELADISLNVGVADEISAVNQLWDLCKRHGVAVLNGVRAIQAEYGDLTRRREQGSLLELVAQQEYLVPPAEAAAVRIASKLAEVLPIAFRAGNPDHENALNDQIDVTLRSMKMEFEREGPTTRYAGARTIPDHGGTDCELLVEGKYPREKSSLADITDQIAADCVKYPSGMHILFVIYDPYKRVLDAAAMERDFKKMRAVTIRVVR